MLKTVGSGNNIGGPTGTLGALTGISKGSTAVANNEVWVRRWVDYSSKYGLGYILSNGSSGVFFNDNSKILLNPREE